MKLVIDWEINCGTVALYRNCETGRSAMELVFEWEIDCGNEMGVLYRNCETGRSVENW